MSGSTYSFKENRLIGYGSFSAGAGHASVAAARAAAPGHGLPQGQAGLTPHGNTAASLAAYTNTVTSYLNALDPNTRSTLQSQANSMVDPAIDEQESFIRQLAAAQAAQEDAKLQQVKDQEALGLKQTTNAEDQTVGDALRKSYIRQYGTAYGGGGGQDQEFGQGSGEYRGLADAGEAARNLVVQNATDTSQGVISRAQSTHDYNLQVGNLGQQKDILAEENQRTADRSSALSTLLGLQSDQSTVLQTPGLTNTSPVTPTAGPPPAVTGYSDAYTQRVAARARQDATGTTKAGYSTTLINPPPAF